MRWLTCRSGRVHEIVRLESVAEEAIAACRRLRDGVHPPALHERARTAMATKSILAYRGGFDGDLSEPGIQPRWPRRRSGGGTVRGTRLTDRVLLRFGLLSGAATR